MLLHLDLIYDILIIHTYSKNPGTGQKTCSRIFLISLMSIFYFRDYSRKFFTFHPEIFTLFLSGCAVFVYVRFKKHILFQPRRLVKKHHFLCRALRETAHTAEV